MATIIKEKIIVIENLISKYCGPNNTEVSEAVEKNQQAGVEKNRVSANCQDHEKTSAEIVVQSSEKIENEGSAIIDTTQPVGSTELQEKEEMTIIEKAIAQADDGNPKLAPSTTEGDVLPNTKAFKNKLEEGERLPDCFKIEI